MRDQTHKPSFNISKQLARDRTYYPRPQGVPDGPHDNRFNRADTFDKSYKLSKNPQVKSIPNFYKQMKRDEDTIIKAGRMVDMRDRVTELVYEKSDPVLLLRKDNKTVQMDHMISWD